MRYKILGTIFDLVAYIPLAFPMYCGDVGGESVGYRLSVNGFNFTEFSSWGSLLVTMPIVLLAIAYSKVQNKIKNMLLILFYILNTVTVYNATTAAGEWVRGVADGVVDSKLYILFYLLAMFASLVCLYVHNNMYYEYSEV